MDHDGTGPGPAMSRRSALKLVGAGALAGGLAGLGGAVLLGGPAAAHDPLDGHNEIWDQPTFTAGTNNRTTFEYNPTFYNQLEAWLPEYYANTPVNWIKPLNIWSDGVHVDKNIDGTDSVSYHSYGRAIDLSKMTVLDTYTFERFTVFDPRYNVWHNWSSGLVIPIRKRYWAFVASLAKRFDNVLHYLYNTAHEDHVHVDNAIAGNGASFRTGSRAQTLTVQACLNYIWGYSAVTLDGDFGPQTDSYSQQALARMGISGRITTAANFQQLMLGSLRMGTGHTSY